jgi:phosphoenolpyruvate carboxylase
MLPAWLGSDRAVDNALNSGEHEQLDQMLEQWPFFKSYVEMLEMVLAKAEPDITAYYQKQLVDEEYQSLGVELCGRLNSAKKMMLRLKPLHRSIALLAS